MKIVERVEERIRRWKDARDERRGYCVVLVYTKIGEEFFLDGPMDRDEAVKAAKKLKAEDTIQAKHLGRSRTPGRFLVKRVADVERRRRRTRRRGWRAVWQRWAPVRGMIAKALAFVAALALAAMLLLHVGGLAAGWLSRTLSVPVEQAGAMVALAAVAVALKLWATPRGGRRRR